MKTSIVTLALLLTFITALIVIRNNNNTTLVSETGCCSIDIHKVYKQDIYYVKWEDNTTIDGFTFSEVSDKEGLDWTINEFMDFCYTHHN